MVRIIGHCQFCVKQKSRSPLDNGGFESSLSRDKRHLTNISPHGSTRIRRSIALGIDRSILLIVIYGF